jgi:DNA-binding transcriptional MerR regulator
MVENKTYTIGQVVKKLRNEFPNLSISKVRYLEDEGLLQLERSKGGYRQFEDKDISLLRQILRLQRDRFLPLNVIKQQLSHPEINLFADDVSIAEAPANVEEAQTDNSPISLSQACQKTGLSETQAQNLQSFGLIELKEGEEGKEVDGLGLKIMETYAAIQKYGVEPRHLRSYSNFAKRETTFVKQILSPQIIKRKTSLTSQGGSTDLGRLVLLLNNLKRLLLEKSLRSSGMT